MQVRIVKPGLMSTIQDLGRENYLPDAVPVSGAMDTLSARIANIVLGNPENAAVIEFTYSGSELTADNDMLIAFSGTGAILEIDGQIIPADRPVFVPVHSSLKLLPSHGSRSYLAVAGGWDVPLVLGSRSTYITAGFGGLNGRCLKENDVLQAGSERTELTQKILDDLQGYSLNYPKWAAAREAFLPKSGNVVRVIPAHEFTWFNADSLLAFLSDPFQANNRSSRMAIQLDGAPLVRNKPLELISTAVSPGTIQVTGDGKLMLLMADCQTTGGYPRIGQVCSVDLPVCAQLKPGDELYFEEISRKDAEKLYLEQEQNFRELRASIELKNKK